MLLFTVLMLTVINIALRISISGLALARRVEKRANKTRKSIERHTEKKVYKNYGRVAGISSFAVNRTIDFYYGQARIVGHAAAIGARTLAENALKIIQKVVGIVRDVLLSMSVYFIVLDFCIFFLLMASSAGFLSLYCTEDAKGNIIFDTKVLSQLETTPTKESKNSSSSNNSSSSGTCKKWNFSDEQLWGIARMCEAEQGVAGLKAMAVQASLMGNQFEVRGHNTPDACIKYLLVPGGTGTYPWDGFYAARTISAYHGSGGNADVFKICKAVLNEGKRVVPAYVDEHDTCPNDIASATNNGSPINTSDRSQYKQHVTVIHNVYGSTYTFYSFPAPGSDPFGYTSQERRKKLGDNCYDMKKLFDELGLKY